MQFILSQLLKHRRRPQRTTRLQFDVLESRTCPATFNPLPATLDGAAGSLREAIITANANGSTVNTFNLTAGSYVLTVLNATGQENTAAQGDLDLTAAGKRYIFKGAGQDATRIDAADIDRAFQIFPGVKVEFRNLTIVNGKAVDNGTAGVLPDLTNAFGGGILNDGGSVSFENVSLLDNDAVGGLGQSAAGGGIYAVDGSLTLKKSTRLEANVAQGGAGTPGAAVVGNGIGGFSMGGAAQGGAIYSDNGTISLSGLTRIEGNLAKSGDGGNGGDVSGGGIGGDSFGGNAEGGAVYSSGGTMSITSGSIVIAGNSATAGDGADGGDVAGAAGGAGGSSMGGNARGGGVYSTNSTLKLAGLTLASNLATGGNGGAGGDVTFGGVGGASFGGDARGAGIHATSGTLTLKRSIVEDNIAQGGNGGTGAAGNTIGGFGFGGGLYLDVASATIQDADINNNQAAGGNGQSGGDGKGGGIFNVSGALLLRRSLITENEARAGSNGEGIGGGLYLHGGTLNAILTLIFGNDADDSNPDIFP